MSARCRIILLALIALAWPLARGEAQRHRYPAAGGWGEGGLVSATGSIAELPGVASCAGDSGAIDGGDGWAVAGGVHLELPDVAAIGPARLWLAFRAGLDRTTLALDSRERIGEVMDGVGNPADLVVEYDRRVEITSLLLGARADVRFSPESSYGILAGAVAAVPLEMGYQYVERIDRPAEAEFVEGGDERNAQSGALASPGIVLGLRAGLFVEWRLDRTVWLRAELAGTTGLTSILNGADLRTGSVRVTMVAVWGLSGDSTPIQEE